MWQHLSRLQERKAEQEKLDKRPECGVYQGYDDDEYFTVIVTSRRRVLVQQATGGLSDMTELWDAKASDTPCPWALQRIDITDGTITK